MSQPIYRALIVDDEAAVRRLTALALGRMGFQCQQAADGRQALQQIESTPFDAVIVDLRMPQHHGHALCIDLLKRPDRPVIIVLTGVMEPKLAVDLRARGIDDICFKPVDYHAFAAKVRTLVEFRQSNGAGSHAGDESPARAAVDSQLTSPATDSPDGKPTSDESAGDVSPSWNDTERHDSPPGRRSGEPDPEPRPQPPAGNISAQTKHIAAVLLRHKDRTREMAERLSSDTVEAVPVEGSEQLYDLLNRQRIDLVVIEQELGGFFTGLEMLERVYRDLLRPETILLADSSTELEEQARMLGVNTVLSPDSTVDDLAGAAQSVLTAMSVTNEFIPHQARKIVAAYDDLPPIPQLLVKLVSYMDIPLEEIPIKDLAQDISVDAKATTELLKLTNSASTGVRRQITKVVDAVNLLGPKRTISMLLSSATFGAQNELLKEWSEPIRRWYQQRSVLIASTASTFAERLENVSPDTAFVLGLLQDIGVLVLANTFRHRYQRIVQRVREIGQLRLEGVEQDEFKMTHADVSAALLQKWALPQSLIRPVLDHHQLEGASDRSVTEQSFLRVMRIGEALANLSDLHHPRRHQTLNGLLGQYGPQPPFPCKSAIAESIARTAECSELFALPLPDMTTADELVERINAAKEEPQAVAAP